MKIRILSAGTVASGYHFSGIIKPTAANDHYGLSVKGMQEQQQQLDALKKDNEQLKKMMQQPADRLK